MAYKRISPQPVEEGGTGAQTLTDHGVLYGSGTAAITASSALTDGQMIIGSTGNDPVNATITSTGASLTVSGGAGTLNIDIAAPVSVANGGTGATTLTDHGVLYGSGTAAITASTALTDGQMIIGSTGSDPVNATITSTGSSLTVSGGAGTLNIDITAPVSVANGGTGATSLTDHSVLVGSGTAAVTAITGGTNGQALIGSTGADPVFATIASSDSLLTLTGGAGTLDITANRATSASSTLTDNLVVRGDGGTRGVQTSTVSINDSGYMTNSSQPVFTAFVSSNISNVTGDNTAYTVVFDTEDQDVGGGYDNSTGTFTAPIAGTYLFTSCVTLNNLSSTHTTGNVSIITAVSKSRSCRISQANFFAAASATGSNFSASGSFIINLAASDTVVVSAQINGSSKTINILGGATGISFFTGCLLC